MAEPEALFQLIVVGSSAGGIEALSKLVASLPIPFSLPLVIAQHLDPKRVSHLGEILRRHTSLPVITLEDQELLVPGTIYVVPSNNHVEITDHDVTLLPDGIGRPAPSVNLLLTSAAAIYGEKLIAVILTGTGSDGTAGAQTVHEAGGTVIIQNPATAAYPGMPGSLSSHSVDFVADLPNIGSVLGALITGSPITTSAQVHPEGELEPLLAQICEYTGIDFSSYKPATILRRLQRRLVATESSDVAAYGLYLSSHPAEYEKLVTDFLIKVTEFMRDPELFKLLQEQILPKLIEYSRAHSNELRLWSAGCATGEEAYSLAIILSEILGEQMGQFHIKIFATDLDGEALAFARLGIYPAKALAKLPPALVERYFTPNADETNYEIKKSLRNLLVFGEHDLGQRAPFPRIDLVLCRNVLIYFDRVLQEHALRLFAFALRDEAYLVLGRTETVNPLAEFFGVEDNQQRIYRRQGQRRVTQTFSLHNVRPLATATPRVGHSSQQPMLERNLFQMKEEARQSRGARDNLLLKLPVGVVVVDARFDIQEINSAARRLLSIHTIAIGEDFVHLAQNIPPRKLSAAITETIRHNTVTTLDMLEVPHLTTGEITFLQLSCYPNPDPKILPDPAAEAPGSKPVELALIIITDLTSQFAARRELQANNSQQAKLVQELTQRITTLERTNADLVQNIEELHQTNLSLSATERTEMDHSNQELQQLNAQLAEAQRLANQAVQSHAHQMEQLVEANNNLLAANEELITQNTILRTDNEVYSMHTEEAQAAIEEAETLNEEMQASNEELEALNEELQATVEELNTSNVELASQTLELSEQYQLREKAKSQLDAILTSMNDAVVVVSPSGEILLTNPAYDRVFQRDNNRLVLLDETGEKFLSSEEWPQARAAAGESFTLSFSLETSSDGVRQWWEAIGQPIHVSENQGKDTHWGLVVMRDITERNLRHSQEQFISLVTHELRTPLTAIKGYTQMVESWLKEPNLGRSERLLPTLGKVLLQTERLEGLITDLGDINRLQNGKFKFYFAPVRLDKLLEQTIEMGQHATTKQTLELTPESEQVSVTVNGDAARLQQLILNLINNAMIHAASSPRISLSLGRVGKLVELRVQDYGPGIKARDQKDLFSRFYQVSHGQAVSGQGLGLGLFICKQIAEAHGGSIKVESVKGEGTTFIVQLPILEPNPNIRD